MCAVLGSALTVLTVVHQGATHQLPFDFTPALRVVNSQQPWFYIPCTDHGVYCWMLTDAVVANEALVAANRVRGDDFKNIIRLTKKAVKNSNLPLKSILITCTALRLHASFTQEWRSWNRVDRIAWFFKLLGKAVSDAVPIHDLLGDNVNILEAEERQVVAQKLATWAALIEKDPRPITVRNIMRGK